MWTRQVFMAIPLKDSHLAKLRTRKSIVAWNGGASSWLRRGVTRSMEEGKRVHRAGKFRLVLLKACDAIDVILWLSAMRHRGSLPRHVPTA